MNCKIYLYSFYNAYNPLYNLLNSEDVSKDYECSEQLLSVLVAGPYV